MRVYAFVSCSVSLSLYVQCRCCCCCYSMHTVQLSYARSLGKANAFCLSVCTDFRVVCIEVAAVVSVNHLAPDLCFFFRFVVNCCCCCCLLLSFCCCCCSLIPQWPACTSGCCTYSWLNICGRFVLVLVLLFCCCFILPMLLMPHILMLYRPCVL